MVRPLSPKSVPRMFPLDSLTTFPLNVSPSGRVTFKLSCCIACSYDIVTRSPDPLTIPCIAPPQEASRRHTINAGMIRFIIYLRTKTPNVQVQRRYAASSRSVLWNAGFGHTAREEASSSKQPAPRNTRKCFTHDFAGYRGVVVGLPSKPPAITEPEVPAQP